MPTIQERPVGLPPPGLAYTLYAPRRADPAVDEQAAAAAEARRRAAADSRRGRRDPALPREAGDRAASASARPGGRRGRRSRRRGRENRTSSCAPSTRSTPPWRDRLSGRPCRRLARPGGFQWPPGRRRPPTRRRSSGDRPRGTPRGNQGPCVAADECGVLLFYVPAPSRCSSTRGITVSSPLTLPRKSTSAGVFLSNFRDRMASSRRACGRSCAAGEASGCKTLGIDQAFFSAPRSAAPGRLWCVAANGAVRAICGVAVPVNEAAPVAPVPYTGRP